jgi:hypothetical protein
MAIRCAFWVTHYRLLNLRIDVPAVSGYARRVPYVSNRSKGNDLDPQWCIFDKWRDLNHSNSLPSSGLAVDGCSGSVHAFFKVVIIVSNASDSVTSQTNSSNMCGEKAAESKKSENVDRTGRGTQMATKTQSTGTACPLLVEIDCPFQWLNPSIVGTVIARAKVETRSIEAASDSTAL